MKGIFTNGIGAVIVMSAIAAMSLVVGHSALAIDVSVGGKSYSIGGSGPTIPVVPPGPERILIPKKNQPPAPPAPVLPPAPTGDPKKDLQNGLNNLKQNLNNGKADFDNHVDDFNRGFKDAMHGIDHFFKEIDHLAKKNAGTLAVVGRIKACTQSLCYSEIYRAQQIKKARQNAEERKQDLLRQSRADIEQKARENNLQSLKDVRQTLEEHLKEIKELNSNYEAEIEGLQALFTQLETEQSRRTALRAMGRQIKKPSSQLADLVDRMSKAVEDPDADTMAQLEADIEARAKSLGVDVETINDEIGQTISDPELETLKKQVNTGLTDRVQMQANLQADITESQAQLDIADANVKKLEAKK